MDREQVEIYREFFYRYIDLELTGKQAKAAKWIVDDLLAHDRIPPMEVIKYLIENSKEEKGLE